MAEGTGHSYSVASYNCSRS